MASNDRDDAARTFGARARIGLVVPTTNTTNEAEWARMTAEGLTFHTARMPLHSPDDDGDALPASLRLALDQLTPASLTCIAYGCTAGSMTVPPDALPGAMADYCDLPCTSTAAAIVAALGHLGAQRVAVATPYHEALNAQWEDFLGRCGFTVTAMGGLGIGAGGPAEFSRLARLTLAEVEAHARATFAAGPGDALLLSCTDMPTLPLLERLEDSLGVPVLSSNSATLWHALQLCGAAGDITGAGQLLRDG